MNASSPMSVEVLIADSASAERSQGVVKTFQDFGFAASIRMVPTRRGLGELSWLVLAALPLQAFFSSLGTKLAEDAHRGLKSFVSRILEKRSAPDPAERALVLQDAATGLQIVLEADLPLEAHRQLLDLDLSKVEGESLRYDRQRGGWRSDPG